MSASLLSQQTVAVLGLGTLGRALVEGLIRQGQLAPMDGGGQLGPEPGLVGKAGAGPHRIEHLGTTIDPDRPLPRTDGHGGHHEPDLAEPGDAHPAPGQSNLRAEAYHGGVAFRGAAYLQ